MSADWSKPTVTSGYTNWPGEVKDRDADLALGLDPAVTAPSNLPTNAIRWNSANARWEKYNGTTWAALTSSYAISISGNAATASAVAWSGISSKPTTRDGFGITDVPKTDGTGASGTWAINVSGNAATATSAGSAGAVAWTNVSGRPTALSSFSNDTGYINSGGRAFPRRTDGADLNFYWSGQSGQPPWLWGGSNGQDMYVYNPSNFSVNYATTAGSAGYATTAGNGGVTSVNGATGAVTVSVDTTSVLNATAGASVGAVGTYALLREVGNPGVERAPGSTLAATNLYYVNTQFEYTTTSRPSGTWRVMGVVPGNQDATRTNTLFLRIS